MPDPSTSGGVLAAVITACGGAIAAVLGAIALFGRKKPQDVVATTEQDPESQPARLRERLTAAETRLTNIERDVEHHDEEISLLRAGQVTTEGLTRFVEALGTDPPARRSPRKRGD